MTVKMNQGMSGYCVYGLHQFLADKKTENGRQILQEEISNCLLHGFSNFKCYYVDYFIVYVILFHCTIRLKERHIKVCPERNANAVVIKGASGLHVWCLNGFLLISTVNAERKYQ